MNKKLQIPLWVWKTMKISSLQLALIALCCGIAHAHRTSGQNVLERNISIQANDLRLMKVLSLIEEQASVRFVYSPSAIDIRQRVTMTVTNRKLENVLREFLLPLSVDFTVAGDRILLKRAMPQPPGMNVREPASSVPPEDADRRISGKVTDEKGEALPGVSILLKETQQGTTTDAEGAFNLGVPDDKAVLVFSFVGYITHEVVVGNRTSIDVFLKVDEKSLEEVVVVGYGTTKKTSLTVAVSTIKGEEIASVPLSNLSNGLGGRMSGVIFKQGSGEPGQNGSDIYIRGISTTGNREPLLIVDNIPRAFQNLDPNSIESITVLKDAAAVAPYGVAGANGVILVTTKKGKKGPPTLAYNGYLGFQNPTVLTDYVNSYEYASLLNAASENAGLPPAFSDDVLQKYKDGTDPDRYPNNSAWDVLNRNTILNNHNLEISGGNDYVSYYAGLGYQYEAGLFAATHQNRFNLNLNLDAQVTKTTKVSFGLNAREQYNSYPSVTKDRMFITITDFKPNWVLFYANGLPGSRLAGMIDSDGYRKTNSTQIFSQLSIDQELNFLPGLKAKATIAFDPTNTFDKRWFKPVEMWTLDTVRNEYNLSLLEWPKARLEQSYSKGTQLTFQGGLTYNRSFGQNNIGFLAIFESKEGRALTMEAIRRNYDLDIEELDMGSSNQADIVNSGSSSKNRQLGLVYRIQYDYNSKYLFEASGRYDGNYYFAPGKQFGFFPAFSIGWRLSEENFIKENFHWVNNLKLRGSYGEVGALAGGAFQYLSTYSVYGPSYVLGGIALQGIRERAESNPNITWERSQKTDIGLEASILNGKLSIEADYFFERRGNMLVTPDVTVPAEYGIGLSQVNAAEMSNRGVEFSFSTNYNLSRGLKLSLGGNITYVKNSLLKVFETSSTYDNPNRRRTGRALGTQFGYKSLGYFQANDFDENGNLLAGIATQPWGKVLPGDIRYEDMNDDGKIDNNDQTVIGNPNIPSIVYGINPSVSYKGIQMDLLFQGAGKSNLYTNNYVGWTFFGGTLPSKQSLDYWTPDNKNALNPRITSAPTANNTQTSSHWIRDSRYIRLKSMTIYYNFSDTIIKKLNLQQIRLFLSGQNIITWTPIVNYDPESVAGSGLNYPQQRVLSIGTNIIF